MKHCTVGGPAAHPERVPLHHMTRDQHTARGGVEEGRGRRKGHKRRETQRDKKQRPGNQTPEGEAGNKDTKTTKTTTTTPTPTPTTTTKTKPPNMLHQATVNPTCSGLRVSGKGNSKIHCY